MGVNLAIYQSGTKAVKSPTLRSSTKWDNLLAYYAHGTLTFQARSSLSVCLSQMLVLKARMLLCYLVLLVQHVTMLSCKIVVELQVAMLTTLTMNLLTEGPFLSIIF